MAAVSRRGKLNIFDLRQQLIDDYSSYIKNLSYIIPIVDYILRHPNQPDSETTVVYPRNEHANSQISGLLDFQTFTDDHLFVWLESTFIQGDFEKLSCLSSDSCSTATTVLSLLAIRHLHAAGERGEELTSRLEAMLDGPLDDLHRKKEKLFF